MAADLPSKVPTDEELEDLLQEREQLSAAFKRWKQIKELITQAMDGEEEKIVARWKLKWRKIDREAYEVKAQTYRFVIVERWGDNE